MDKIFLDSASTTYCEDEVVNVMVDCLKNNYGNPSSTHYFGREASKVLGDTKLTISKYLNCKSNELYFTSSGTEANNLAIFGIARANKDKGKHIITTYTEHQSIIDSTKQLEKEGFSVTYLKADKTGKINIEDVEKNIRQDTILISIMLVNNETGTINDIKKIAEVVKNQDHNIILHTDAVAGLGMVDIDIKDLNVDALSISAQKIYGPKGIGCLYIKQGIVFYPIIFGGNQENGKRAGTANVPAIAGFGKAMELLSKNERDLRQKIKQIKQDFVSNLSGEKGIRINGENTVDTILSVTFDNIDNEIMQTMLDMNGVCCSLGSACTAGSVEPSHALLGMGFDNKEAKSTVRFSFHKSITREQIVYATKIIKESVKRLRNN